MECEDTVLTRILLFYVLEDYGLCIAMYKYTIGLWRLFLSYRRCRHQPPATKNDQEQQPNFIHWCQEKASGKSTGGVGLLCCIVYWFINLPATSFDEVNNKEGRYQNAMRNLLEQNRLCALNEKEIWIWNF